MGSSALPTFSERQLKSTQIQRGKDQTEGWGENSGKVNFIEAGRNFLLHSEMIL